MASIYNWESFIRIHGGEPGARDVFEKAMDELLRAENPGKEVHVVKAAPGDGGIDVYVHHEDGIDIYQCKFFMGSMDSSRWNQIYKSFSKAMEPKGVKVLRWVLCMPREMQQEDIAKWDEFLKERSSYGVEIKHIDGNEIISRMRECDRENGTDLVERYFAVSGRVLASNKLEYIVNYLEEYREYIEYNNSIGLMDAAILFEGFALQICALWFEQRFSNSKREAYNSPYLDLLSDDRQIGIQVSTTKNMLPKIRATLDRAVSNKKYGELNLSCIYFFCLHTVKETRALRTTRDKYREKIDFEIISFDDLMIRAENDIEFQSSLYDFLILDPAHLQINKTKNEGKGIIEYYDYVNKLYSLALGGERFSKDELQRSYIPLYCYSTNGQKENLESVISDFVINNANGVMWIVGEAGSGKTTMCLKAVNSSDQSIYSSSRVYWIKFANFIDVECIGPEVLEFDRSFVWMSENDAKPDKLEIENNSIVYLDDYDEVPLLLKQAGKDIDIKEVSEAILRLAKKYNLHIIVTSRQGSIEGKYQGSLDNGTAAIRLFNKGNDDIIPMLKIAPLSEQIRSFMFVLTDKKPSRYKESSIYLVKNHIENDKYNTAYNMYTSYQMGYLDLIGTVKIAFHQMNPDDYISINNFTQLDEGYYSLGQSEEYYMNIYNCFGEDYARAILQALRDVAYDDRLYKKNKNDNAMRFSLMHSLSELNIRDSFRELAEGNSKQIRYRFDYTLSRDKNTEVEERISFDIDPASALPSNMYALVGRNGVGKSKLISDMIGVIERNKRDYFHEYDADGFPIMDTAKEIFNNLVYVSYSVFDEISTAFVEERAIPLDYIGIRSVENIKKKRAYVINKNKDELTSDFSNAIKRCINLGKKSLWAEVIEILNSDPIFRDSKISSLFATENIHTAVLASEAIFNELSSGHKIVLLTLTQLIAVVKERTLLFIDEPELHLHPPLVASYIQSISYLLKKKNGVAIVATHSPVVLQEIPAKCVWHINRSGSFLTARHPRIQTYGENLGVITKEIFRHELEDTGHRKVLSRLSDEGLSFEEIMDRLENQLGIEGQMMLSMILGYRDEKHKET